MRTVAFYSSFLVIATCLVATLARGQAPEAERPYFYRVAAEDLSGEDVSAYVVHDVVRGMPAEEAGILRGDVILAVGGWRVFEMAEAAYVKRYRLERSPSVNLIVNRRGTILEFELDDLPLDRMFGVGIAPDGAPWALLAERLGMALTPEQKYVLGCTQPRMALLVARWLDEDPSRLEQAGWLRDLLRMRLELGEQNWRRALSFDGEIPLPEFRRLADFWLSVAKRNLGGEKTPDPAAHGVDVDYYCFHYPLPRFVPPPLKDFDSADPFWKKWVQDHAANPLHIPDPALLDRVFAPKDPDAEATERYLSRVKLSVVSPTDHGGWPFWYAMRNGVEGDELYEDLVRLKRDDPADRALYTYALAQFVLTRDDREAMRALMDELFELSPFLAWRAAGNNRRYLFARELEAGEYEAFLAWCAERRGQMGPKTNKFLEYVRARTRETHLQVDSLSLPSYDERSLFYPGSLRCAVERERPFDEEYAALQQAIRGKDPKITSGELYGRLEKLIGPQFCWTDADEMRNIANRRRSSGLLLESMNRVLDRCDLPPDAETIFQEFSLVHKSELNDGPKGRWGYAYVRRQLQSLDWSDRAAATAQAESLFRAHGTLAGTVEIAAAFRAHGFAEEAARYDDLLELHVDLTWPWFERYRMTGFRLHEYAAGLADHPTLAARMERELRRYREFAGDRNDESVCYSDDLEAHRARCLLTMGRPQDAAAALIGSYALPPKLPPHVRTRYEGKSDNDLNAYRRWLAGRLADDPGVSAEAKERLASLSAEPKPPN